MRYFRLTSLWLATSALLFSSPLFAAAFQFYELGSPIIGTAAVGQAVVANDASISYYNPAGMARLSHSQYLLGTQLIVPTISFSKSSRTTISGNNGGNAGSLTPGVGFFYVYNYAPQLKLGVSLTTPYAGMLNYNDGWVGRYTVQYLQLYALDLNPALAYQVNPWLALGVGASIEYANLQQTVALPIPGYPLVDGQVNLKVSSFAPGFNVGVMLTPTEVTKVGLTFRSRITHDLKGDVTFLRLSVQPNASTSMVMPQNMIASISQDINKRFSVLGEAGWAAWSAMKNTVVDVDGFSSTTQMNWHDTYRLGIGGRFLATDALLLQAGASFDSSPTTSSLRLPDLPMDRQIRVGVGLIYALHSAAKLGFSYEYINFGNANINTSSPQGMLVGSYARNFANVFQASINVDC